MLTINADHHELMKAFHKPTDEKRMVMIMPEAAYGDWLSAPPEHSMDFMQLLSSGSPRRDSRSRPMSRFATISLAAAVLTCSGTAHGDVLEGKVVGITDGDTVTVLVDPCGA